MNQLRKQPSKTPVKEKAKIWLRFVLMGLFGAGIFATAVGIWFGYVWLDKPIELITVKGEFAHIQQGELEALVAPKIDGGIVSLNLSEINKVLKQQVWIKHASVSRQWPNGLIIHVEEETPVARWKKQGFLNSTGQLLTIEDNSNLQNLTLLDGADGDALEVMTRYREIVQLLAAHDLSISAMGKNDSGIWYLELKDGPSVVYGRQNIIDKTHRFLIVWRSSLHQQKQQLESVDLRYSNGLAVGWKQQQAESTEAES